MFLFLHPSISKYSIWYQKAFFPPYDLHLLILEGTFSDDMITTGISFRYDDSWIHKNQTIPTSEIWYYIITFQIERGERSTSNTNNPEKNNHKFYLNFLEQIISSHPRHGVVCNDQVHLNLMLIRGHQKLQSLAPRIHCSDWNRNKITNTNIRLMKNWSKKQMGISQLAISNQNTLKRWGIEQPLNELSVHEAVIHSKDMELWLSCYCHWWSLVDDAQNHKQCAVVEEQDEKERTGKSRWLGLLLVG